MLNLATRNLRIFFRDTGAVFFSFLGVIVVIGLYVLFLGEVTLKSFNELTDAKNLLDGWIMGGLVAVTSLTTTMGAMGVMIEDKVYKRFKDFNASPIPRTSLAGGYVLSTLIVGIMTSIFALIFAEIYICAYGGSLLSLADFAKMLGLIFLSVFTSTAMVFLLVSFFKSSNAFTAASTVIGTLVGFVTGTYIPIGDFPDAVQWIIRLFPISHASAMMREIFTKNAIEHSFSAVPEIARPEAIAQFKDMMGITLSFGDTPLTPLAHIGILVGVGLIFFLFSVLNISRKAK